MVFGIVLIIDFEIYCRIEELSYSYFCCCCLFRQASPMMVSVVVVIVIVGCIGGIGVWFLDREWVTQEL